MTEALILALSKSEGTLLTIGIIVLLALVLGVLVITSDTNWFD
jgi:hypothetical protein